MWDFKLRWRALRRNLACLCRTGKTERGFATTRLQQLQRQYFDDMDRYYRPPSERKQRSAHSLFLFPEAQLLHNEAKHSIRIGDFTAAHQKIDRGFEVLREAAHERFSEMMRAHQWRVTKPRRGP